MYRANYSKYHPDNAQRNVLSATVLPHSSSATAQTQIPVLRVFVLTVLCACARSTSK